MKENTKIGFEKSESSHYNNDLDELKKRIDLLEQEIISAKLWKNGPNEKCLDISEVAELLGCSKETVKKYEKQGLLPAEFPMAKKRYHYQDVEKFMRGYRPAQRKRVHQNFGGP